MTTFELVIRPDDVPATCGKLPAPGKFAAGMRIDGEVVESGRPH